MNKRIVAGMLFTTVVCMTLGGCGFTADKENVKNSGAVESVMPGAEVSTEMTERDAEADNGVGLQKADHPQTGKHPPRYEYLPKEYPLYQNQHFVPM